MLIIHGGGAGTCDPMSRDFGQRPLSVSQSLEQPHMRGQRHDERNGHWPTVALDSHLAVTRRAVSLGRKHSIHCINSMQLAVYVGPG